MAPDFVVEGAHRLTLQVEIEIHVEFASLAEIAPDRRRRRFGALPRLAQQRRQARLIEPDPPGEAAGRRHPGGPLRPPHPPRGPRDPPPPPAPPPSPHTPYRTPSLLAPPAHRKHS